MSQQQRWLIYGLSIFLLSSSLWGCDYARMREQESIRPYETSLPEMPQGTIPVDGGIEVLRKAKAEALKNPLEADEESRQRGKDAYGHYCLMCHGPKADGNGVVGQSFYPLPTNLKSPYVQNQTDGSLFIRISRGYKRHPYLADTASESDRWAVIHYLRSLGKEG